MKFLSLHINWIVVSASVLAVLFQAEAGQLPAADDKSDRNKVVISIHETSSVSGSDVFLGQIANISANVLVKEALERLIVGSSPKPDKLKAFDRKKIISLINRQQYLPADMEIISPEIVYVKRPGQKIIKESITAYVEKLIEHQFSPKEYKLISLTVHNPKTLPQGKLTFKTDKEQIVDAKGRLSFFLEFFVNGNLEDKAKVSGTVAVYEHVVHLSAKVKKGYLLKKSDLYLEKKNVFELGGNYIKDYHDAENKIVKISIKKGAWLKANLLKEPFLVKKGDVVVLVAKNDNLMIETAGICQENGFADHMVKVENLTSGKLVRGIVKDKSKVEVVY